MRATRIVVPSETGQPYYIFLLVPYLANHSDQDNRVVRANFLGACCKVLKHVYPDALEVVGIATDHRDADDWSVDYCFVDLRVWSDEDEREAVELQKKLRIFVNLRRSEGVVEEYPSVVIHKAVNAERNKPCPCGSGKKYKHCCGK
jgi:uncharacterized protein YchJ